MNKSLLTSDLPRWYGLRFCAHEPAIVVDIVNDYVSKALDTHNLCRKMRKTPIVPEHASVLSHSSCVWERNSAGFGHNGGWKPVGQEIHGFTSFSLKLPALFHAKGSCVHCDATGRNESAHLGKCQYCEGTGKELVHNKFAELTTAYNLVTMLTVLRGDLFTKSECTLPQLAELNLVVDSPPGVQGEISPTASLMISQFSRQRGGFLQKSVLGAMCSAHSKMCGECPGLIKSMGMECYPDMLTLSCLDATLVCGEFFQGARLVANGSLVTVNRMCTIAQAITLLVGMVTLLEFLDHHYQNNKELLRKVAEGSL